jgi:hypothetical protein
MGSSTSHNPIGLQGLLQGELYFTFNLYRQEETVERETFSLLCRYTVRKEPPVSIE